MSQNKHENIHLKVILGALVLAALFLGAGIYVNVKAINAKEERLMSAWLDTEAYCSGMFTYGIVNEDITESELGACQARLDAASDQSLTEIWHKSIQAAKAFFETDAKVAGFYDGQGILREEVMEGDIAETERMTMTLRKAYRKKLEGKLDDIRANFDQMTMVKGTVLAMFDNAGSVDELLMAQVSVYVDREQYNQAKELIETLAQLNLKSKLSSALEKVEQKVAEDERRAWEEQEQRRLERERILREREEAERRRQEEIAAAWHILDIPYISQNHSEVYNGCEAAALLMSLKYKGFLTSKSYLEFVAEMPKTDNPSTGFYLDIYDTEPRNEAHWIDTEPLVKYGRESAGTESVEDLRGNDIGVLNNEIMNGNPVVIYLTYDLRNPEEIVGGVPVNLHVVVLSGYNHITNEYQIVDPWTRRTGEHIFTLAGSLVENIYNQVGQRAVVVRS